MQTIHQCLLLHTLMELMSAEVLQDACATTAALCNSEWLVNALKSKASHLLQELDSLQVLLPEVVGLGQHKEALCILHQAWLHCIHFLYLHSVIKSEALPTMSVSNAVCQSCDCPIKVLLASLQSLHKHLAKTGHCECCSTVIYYNTCLNYFKGHKLRQATTSYNEPIASWQCAGTLHCC